MQSIPLPFTSEEDQYSFIQAETRQSLIYCNYLALERGSYSASNTY